MPITIAAGGQVSQLIELPRASSLLGELQVRTEPAGAQVTVDGHVYGQSPLTVEGLAPGAHSVVLENELGSMTQDVKIEAGTTASLVVPLTRAQERAGLGMDFGHGPGAAADLRRLRGLLGTSQSDRIMVSVGRHELILVNEAIGFSQSQVVNVTPGRVTPIKPRWPSGAMSFNATPVGRSLGRRSADRRDAAGQRLGADRNRTTCSSGILNSVKNTFARLSRSPHLRR